MRLTVVHPYITSNLYVLNRKNIMILEAIWAAGFLAGAVASSVSCARFDRADNDDKAMLYGFISLCCYMMALGFLGDRIAMQVFQGVSNLLPEYGTVLHDVTALLLSFGIAVAGAVLVLAIGQTLFRLSGRSNTAREACK